MFDFVCVGDATVDNFYFIEDALVHSGELDLKYGSKIPVAKHAVCLGGNAANVAVGLAKLLTKTALLTTFGDDQMGAWIKRELLKNNVDLEFSKIDQKRESNSSAIIVFGGERTILTYHAMGKDLATTMPESKWVYLTSSAGRDSMPLFEKVLKIDSRLAFNPSMEDIKKNTEIFREVLGRTDVLIVNKEEWEALGLKSLKSLIVITDGKNGAVVTDEGKTIQKPAVGEEAMEPTGAGDAFSSGFIGALFYGKNTEEALDWGLKNSGSVIRKVGATDGLLTKNEIS